MSPSTWIARASAAVLAIAGGAVGAALVVVSVSGSGVAEIRPLLMATWWACAAAVLLMAAGPSRLRTPFLLTGTAFVIWDAARLVGLSSPPVPGARPEPAGFISLICIAMWLVALVMLLRRSFGRIRWSRWLDAAVTLTACAAVISAVAVGALAGDGRGANLPVGLVVAELFMLGVMTIGIGLRGWRLAPGWGFLLGGVITLSASQTLYAYEMSAGAYRVPSLADVGGHVGVLLIAVACTRLRAERPEPGGVGVRMAAVPMTFAVIALAVLCAGAVVDVNPVAVVLATVAIALGLVRGALMFREVVRVNADLDRARQRSEAAEARLAHLAMHDELTGLANRRQLEAALADRRDRFAVVYIDLDGFKRINDEHGHQTGDELLRVIGRRLRAVTREQDVVARMGGDEFAVVCPGVIGMGEAEVLANRVVERLSEPVALDGVTVAVGASVGVSVCRTDGAQAGDQLRRADQAMYAAKASGRGRVVMATA